MRVGDLDDLAPAPNLVGDLSQLEPVPAGCRSTRPPGWITKERSPPATSATPGGPPALKGQTLFGVFSQDLVAFLERVIAWDGRSWEG